MLHPWRPIGTRLALATPAPAGGNPGASVGEASPGAEPRCIRARGEARSVRAIVPVVSAGLRSRHCRFEAIGLDRRFAGEFLDPRLGATGRVASFSVDAMRAVDARSSAVRTLKELR